MKRQRKERGPREMRVPTKQHVTLVKRFKGTQVLLDVADSEGESNAVRGIGWVWRLTRHVKDGTVIIRSLIVDLPLVGKDGILKDENGDPKTERVNVIETWEVPHG